MNWKEISDKYPKAWERFFLWACERMEEHGFNDSTLQLHDRAECGTALYRAGGYESGYDLFPMRDTYDFFDIEGVLINVSWDPIAFDYHIYDLNFVGSHSSNQDNFGSRSECESEAFTKAFSILEERLAK